MRFGQKVLSNPTSTQSHKSVSIRLKWHNDGFSVENLLRVSNYTVRNIDIISWKENSAGSNFSSLFYGHISILVVCY